MTRFSLVIFLILSFRLGNNYCLYINDVETTWFNFIMNLIAVFFIIGSFQTTKFEK